MGEELEDNQIAEDSASEFVEPSLSDETEPAPAESAQVQATITEFQSSVRRFFKLGLVVLSVLSVIGIVIGFVVRVPYVALVPGSARETESLLDISGIETFGSDGEILFTTVRVKQQPSFWQYLWLKNDRDAEVVPEELVNGDRTADQTRDFNLQLMNDAKSVSIAVALEELGYDAVQVSGVIIAELVKGGSAEGVIEPFDSITTLDDKKVESTADLVGKLSEYQPGDVISVGILKPDGAESVLDIPLGSKPDDPEAAFLGIAPRDNLELNDELGFEVEIDSGDVGGPSAGLAFSLAVLDDLTPGELTGGDRIAVTGTMNVDGTVGPIGGIVQKVAAVGDLGIENFLIPASLSEEELEAAFSRANDDVNLIPVANLSEALDALEEIGGDVGAVEEFAIQNTASTS